MSIYDLIPFNMNEEIARAVINNPFVSYDDLESLYWQIVNTEAMGMASPLLNEISNIQGMIVLSDIHGPAGEILDGEVEE